MSENEESKAKNKENKSIEENTKSLSLKRNKPVRPHRLRIKTGYSYYVNLPTYEESQEKYKRFLCTLKNAYEKQK